MNKIKLVINSFCCIKILGLLSIVVWKFAIYLFPIFPFFYLLLFLTFLNQIFQHTQTFMMLFLLICGVASINIPFCLAPYTQKKKYIWHLLVFQFTWLFLTAFSLKKRKECIKDMENAINFMKFDRIGYLCLFFTFLMFITMCLFSPPDIVKPLREQPFPFLGMLPSHIQLPFLLYLWKKTDQILIVVYRQKILPFLLLQSITSGITIAWILSIKIFITQTSDNVINTLFYILLYSLYFILASFNVLMPFMVIISLVWFFNKLSKFKYKSLFSADK